MRWLRIGGMVVVVCFALMVTVLGGMLLFGTVNAPPVASGFGYQFRGVDYSDLPPFEYYRARDGVGLAYRSYLAPATDVRPQKIAVLIHGASVSSAGMHVVAQALARAGVSCYVPGLRGHGANQPHGDICYRGQLEDDHIDFMRQMRLNILRRSGPWLVSQQEADLRCGLTAARGGNIFDQYLLLAPGLRYDAPTSRPLPQNGKDGSDDASRFVAPYTGRLIAITVLRGLGIHWFDGLTVLAFCRSNGFSTIHGGLFHAASGKLLAASGLPC